MNSDKNILIAGGSGLIGKLLSKYLVEHDYNVSILSRQKKLKNPNQVFHWDPSENVIDEQAILTNSVIINLCGASVASRRWTHRRKKEIINSRIVPTLCFKSHFEKLGVFPKQYIAASAIGIYGNASNKKMTEESKASGNHFLTQVCKEWEKSIQSIPSQQSIITTIRIGLVLSNNGGPYAILRNLGKTGVYNYFGSGKQYYSWIHELDLVRIFVYALENNLNGVYNATAPQPATNYDFTNMIAKAKSNRSLVFGLPSFLLKFLLGEMSDAILTGQNVSADKIRNTDFVFDYPDLTTALNNLT